MELPLLLLINLLVSETRREIVIFSRPCFCETNRKRRSWKYFVSESRVTRFYLFDFEEEEMKNWSLVITVWPDDVIKSCLMFPNIAKIGSN